MSRPKNGPVIVPAGNLWSGSDSAETCRKCRRMQRLADVANRVRAALVLVQQASAGRKKEQGQANQRCADAPQR
jgi:hypothetical protein